MKFFQLHPFLLVLILLVTLKCEHSHSSQLHITNNIRCLERERQALLNIKSELVDTYGRLSSWGNDENKRDDCCEWAGVHCHNTSNHVTQLNLQSYNLKGTISTSLSELHHLRYLDLSFNDFEFAPIPELIGSLTKLQYLNLASANFSGPIPHQIGNLSKLHFLDISYNDCYSENLGWLFSFGSLEHLRLSFTNLSKATNWLEAVSKLTSIKELDLNGGSLPKIPLSLLPEINGSSPLAILDLSNNLYPSITKLIHWFSNFSSTDLSDIFLGNNNIAGPIPDIFENMMSLEHLFLFGNGLQGGIPKYFGNLSSLARLTLSENNLSGDIYKVMMNLSAGPLQKKLVYLDLSWNSFSGLLPNMSRFSSLTGLYLDRNQLSGSIREGYLRLPSLASLDLSSNRLIGPLPDLSFSSSLEFLSLANNTFNGTLSHNIGRLSQLQILDLSFNSFLEVQFKPSWVPHFQLRDLILEGCRLGKYFPKWLKTQKELDYINIAGTGISDILPSWFGGSFRNFSLPIDIKQGEDGRWLDISRNKISGSLNFLCHVKEWVSIDVSDNLFSGQIPDCFANSQRLTFLSLANNRLSGKIPHSFGQLSVLTFLNLRNNSLSGGLPTTMRNCKGLKMIDLGGNRLTGKVPSWMGDSFPELIVLVLRFNQFYGNLPSNICRLPKLQVLDISSNMILGTIPECLQDYVVMSMERSSDDWYLFAPKHAFNVRENVDSFENAYFMWKGKEVKYTDHLGLVKLIDFSDNALVGEIPFNITKLVGLVEFNISNNNLTGQIPPHIGEMKSLNSLDFSRNRFSGGIPASLCDLSGLGVLNLSYNNLSGRIPQDNHCLTFEEPAYIGNVGLCGSPLDKSCPRDEFVQDPNSTIDEDDDDRFITRGFYIALALGFILGFWGIYGTVLLNKTIRYAVFNKFNSIRDLICLRIELSKARFSRYFQNQ